VQLYAASCPNVTWILGNSRHKLLEVLQSLDDVAIVWLDAHQMRKQEKVSQDVEICPLLAELAALNACDRQHFVVIDDSRLIIDNPPSPDDSHWPSFQQMKDALNRKYHYYIANFEDEFIAVPLFAEKVVYSYIYQKER